jgi:hypothetical protein
VPQENNQPFAKLRRFVEPQRQPQLRERCEFCGVEIAERHSHAVNTETRSLLCVCRPCYLLFTRECAARGKFRAVPERYLYAPGLILTDAQWSSLQIPWGSRFFFNTSLGRMVVFYPALRARRVAAFPGDLGRIGQNESTTGNPCCRRRGAAGAKRPEAR